MPACSPSSRPEVLAPLGGPESLPAALSAGADAVYFGLDEGFHARAKTLGFGLHNLASTVQEIHNAGARAYVTLNTLVFQSELETLVGLIENIARAGVDAVIVQDPAVCTLVQRIAPDLAIHASTQMTISSPEAARFAESLGVRRVVVPRELSLKQIEAFARGSSLELEVFVHGALCMAWSGQCLSGEAWVGRSANRGQCNQGCRMPYDLVLDGQTQDLGEHRYLLSPKDLAAVDEIDALVELGVASLKIEGRYKGPAYVRANVEMYRAMVAGSVQDGQKQKMLLESAMVYSRGFSPGHLRGSAHQDLVDGRFPKHRGHFLGEVETRKGSVIWIDTSHGLRGQIRLQQWPPQAPAGLVAGAGLVIDGGDPQDKDEAGGRVYVVESAGEQRWKVDLGPRAKQMQKIRKGHRVWISAPAPRKEGGRPNYRGNPYTLVVRGRCGEPLELEVHCERLGLHARARSERCLEAASSSSLDASRIADKFQQISALGLVLQKVQCEELDKGLFIPPSALKQLRRELAAQLAQARRDGYDARVIAHPVASELIGDLGFRDAAIAGTAHPDEPEWVVLCRTMEQLQACIDAGFMQVDLDWMEFVGLSKAVEHARKAGCVVNIATVRVQKPGEEGYDRRIASLQPDGVLIRHFGALMRFSSMEPTSRPALHGDFSLNCTNSITARRLLDLGLDTVTASHDLNDTQVEHLMLASPGLPLTLTLHHHLSLFHNDHCIYAKYLSDGQDFRTCNRPCDRHKLHLRDHQGQEHPVIVDVECRNTVFSAQAQSAAHYLPVMRGRGISRYRIEFAWESQADARRILEGYRALGQNRIDADELNARLHTIERFGVTLGTLADRESTLGSGA